MLNTSIIFALSIGFPLILTVVFGLIIKRRNSTLDADENAVINVSMTVLSGAYTFLVAFLIVNVWNGQVERVGTLGSELNKLNSLYNQRMSVPLERAPELKQLVVDYLHKVSESEIQKDGPPDGDREANLIRAKILKLVADARPGMPQQGVEAKQAEQFVISAQEWSDARLERLTKTYPQVNWIYIVVVLLLGMSVLFVSAILTSGKEFLIIMAKLAGVDLMVGLLLGLLFFTGSRDFILGDEVKKLQLMETVIQTERPTP